MRVDTLAKRFISGYKKNICFTNNEKAFFLIENHEKKEPSSSIIMIAHNTYTYVKFKHNIDIL